jgi:hypothetical protein
MLRKRIAEFLNRDNVNATATVALAVATLALCVIAVLQWRTLEKTDMTMRLQQRAFFAPRGLEIPNNFKTGNMDYTEISIEIENVGKEPAIKTNEGHLFAATLPMASFRNREAVERLIQNHMDGAICESLPVSPGGRAIYPGGRVGIVVGLTKAETGLALAHSDYALVAGCLVYETLNEKHYSEVCTILVRQLA